MGQILYPGYFPNCETPFVKYNPNLTLEQLMYLYWVVRDIEVKLIRTDEIGRQEEATGYIYRRYAGRICASEEEVMCGADWFPNVNIEIEYNELIPILGDLSGKLGWGDDSTFTRLFLGDAPEGCITLTPLGNITATYGNVSIQIPQYDCRPGNAEDHVSISYIRAASFFSYGGTWDTQTGKRLK